MLKSYISAWKRSFDFQGKSTRKEYWYFVILNSIIFLIAYLCSLSVIVFTNDLDSSFPIAISIPLYFISLIGLLLFSSLLYRFVFFMGKRLDILIILAVPLFFDNMIVNWSYNTVFILYLTFI